MERRARILFRNALCEYYMEGAQGGREAEEWLKAHGGWFPDPQVLYGDGTPLTQPSDEGELVRSSTPILAMEEARSVMALLYRSPDFRGEFKAEVLTWINSDALLRLEARNDSTSTVGMLSSNGSRSRSRSRESNRETSIPEDLEAGLVGPGL